MIKGKTTILFDMDGVLVNSEPQHYEAWNKVFASLGFQMPWDPYKYCIGSILPHMFEMVEDYIGRPVEHQEELLSQYKTYLEEILNTQGVQEVPGVKELLPALKEAGYRLAVASSSPMPEIKKTINALGIGDNFECLFTGESVPQPKPAPDTFLYCAKAVGAAPEECIVIEDSYNGTLAGKRAGMYCIGIKNPDSGDQDLSNADVTVHEFKDLRELLL